MPGRQHGLDPRAGLLAEPLGPLDRPLVAWPDRVGGIRGKLPNVVLGHRPQEVPPLRVGQSDSRGDLRIAKRGIRRQANIFLVADVGFRQLSDPWQGTDRLAGLPTAQADRRGRLSKVFPQGLVHRFLRLLQAEALHDGLADYNEALRLKPAGGDAYYYNRGLAYWNKGDQEEAMADFNESFRLLAQRARAERPGGGGP